MALLSEMRPPAGSIVAGRTRHVGATAEIANHAIGGVEAGAGLERVGASLEHRQDGVREEPVARGPHERRRIDVCAADEEATGPAGGRVGKPVEGHGRTRKESTERTPRKKPVAPGMEALTRKQIVRKETGAADVVGVSAELHLNATEAEKKLDGRGSGRLVLDADAQQRVARTRPELETQVAIASIRIQTLHIVGETIHVDVAQVIVTNTRRAPAKPQPRPGDHPELALSGAHRVEEFTLGLACTGHEIARGSDHFETLDVSDLRAEAHRSGAEAARRQRSAHGRKGAVGEHGHGQPGPVQRVDDAAPRLAAADFEDVPLVERHPAKMRSIDDQPIAKDSVARLRVSRAAHRDSEPVGASGTKRERDVAGRGGMNAPGGRAVDETAEIA